MLNVAQNIYWKPDQQVLSLPNLKMIYLIKFLYHIADPTCLTLHCHLTHNNETNAETLIKETSRSIQKNVDPRKLPLKSEMCWLKKLVFRDPSYWKVIDDKYYHFYFEVTQSRCLSNRYNHIENVSSVWFYFKITTTKDFCWSTIQRIHIIPLTEGICAMVFNLIVIMTTLRSRVLRESVAHVLVANIAVGDLLISLYMIIITSTRQSMSAENYDSMHLPLYCRMLGLIFLIGQFSSPFMSLIMTLERYLAVVYCMRPHIRITRRMTYVAMVIVWGLSLASAVSFMTSPQLSTKPDTMCIPLTNINRELVLHYVGGIGCSLYIIAIALYIHMYVDFKKTNQKTVQLQRENRLARSIAVIIFTNILFFIFPLALIAVIFNIKVLSHVHEFIFGKTFGIACLGINSCFNPIFFSFKNEKFRNELKRHCFLCSNTVVPQPMT